MRTLRGNAAVPRYPLQGDVLVQKAGSKTVGRPRLVSQAVLDKMVSLRRQGHSMREIAKKVHRSERTVRRYVKGIQPHVELRTDLDSAELMDWFFDELLSKRRWITAAAAEHYKEQFDLGVEAVDAAMRLLRERLGAMDKITVERLRADESLRRQFFEEFTVPVIVRWVRELKSIHVDRTLEWRFGGPWVDVNEPLDEWDERHGISTAG